MTAVARPRASLPSIARGALAWWLGELAALVPDRLKRRRGGRSDAEIRVSPQSWMMRDRRGRSTEIDPRDTAAALQAFRSLRQGRKPARATLIYPLSRCFVRHTELPRSLLSHAGSILASELETVTPFQTGSVHWDWFVRGEGTEAGALTVAQIVLKRRDTEAIAQRLAEAGVAVATLSVEDEHAAPPSRRLPVDLQRHDRPGEDEPHNLRKARSVLVGAAVLTAIAIVPLAFTQQSAILSKLDQDIADATDTVAGRPGLARAPLQALGEILQAKRNLPPATAILDGLAAALPPDSNLDHLFLDKDVVTIQGRTTSVHVLEHSLSASPLFAAGHNTAAPGSGSEGIAFTIRLKVRPLPSTPEI
ncbi:hypothetical protein [Lichenifustis flavocetrariae]|uniref:PilN domain-containing protein n=1 Tax=Lichenifustis flavocetrariae TaxID=2949735 RepID=A0AA42CK18_9HYPH|nr:hypothetical protein [Lichenifustis flavocetrariae]MCW6508716.1 PilN domain-containing protein [Lichenifustis flavocetrariae]